MCTQNPALIMFYIFPTLIIFILANVCLQCLEPVNSEEEPVHKNCLPHYPLCIRCLTNKRSDPSHYCAHCLIYDQGTCMFNFGI